MSIKQQIIANKKKLSVWRQQIHAYPEIAFQEEQTARFVEQVLTELGVTVLPRMAGTGVIGSISTGKSNRSIALRADMDALPVEELNDLPYRSKNTGMMHACGHDGHTAMLLGAAEYLVNTQQFSGTVYFIFQPAEENEGGGRRMVEEGLFDKYPVEAVYGMHNWPGLELGKIAIRSGPVMAACDVFDITISGKGGHAAAPQTTVDPIVIAGQVITAIQAISSRQIAPLEAIVVSITRIHAGDSYNVIPEQLKLAGTVRTFSADIQEQAVNRLNQIVHSICKAYGATAEINYQKLYPATINTDNETEQAKLAAMKVVGQENLVLDKLPSMGSEDFSFLLNACRGSYIWLGNGDSAGLHNPHYDFNDEALVIGASYWATLTEMQLT